MLKKLQDIKTLFEETNYMSNIHDYHVFRFKKVNGRVLIDVKEFSDSPWTIVDGTLMPIPPPSESNLSEQQPNFEMVNKLEESLNLIQESRFLDPQQALKLRQEIRDIEDIQSRASHSIWKFADFENYSARPQAEAIVSPFLLDSVEETFVPRPPVIGNRRITVTKKHVYVGDLVAFLQGTTIIVGTIVKILTANIIVLPWSFKNGKYELDEQITRQQIPRLQIMASGLRFNGRRTFDASIQEKLDNVVRQYTEALQLRAIIPQLQAAIIPQPQAAIIPQPVEVGYTQTQSEIPIYTQNDPDILEDEDEEEDEMREDYE